MASLDRLAAFVDRDTLHVVVEAPRGSRLKLEYDTKLRAFKAERPLPVGLAYPFDWGFIPGTRAADGDPVDAMVLNDVPTYPGMVIEGKPLGMVEVMERAEGQTKELANPRILVAPAWVTASLPKLSRGFRDQLAQFFVSVGETAGKQVRVAGWGSAEDALAYVKAHLQRE
jgi:inorganic pyrophosphatase